MNRPCSVVFPVDAERGVVGLFDEGAGEAVAGIVLADTAALDAASALMAGALILPDSYCDGSCCIENEEEVGGDGGGLAMFGSKIGGKVRQSKDDMSDLS